MTPASPRPTSRFADRWARKDCRILLERLSTPLGPSGAKNLAIAKATGDFLVVIDGDGILHPMALGIFARQLSHNPAVNFVFTNEAEIDARSKTLSFSSEAPARSVHAAADQLRGPPICR